jgi:RNA polymerase sigma-70 factor, ECF subfamily
VAVALKNWSLGIPWTSHERTAGAVSVTEDHITTERTAEWEESDLVRDAQAGDSEAFERLYETHVRRIYALCLRMLSDPVRAEDVTQDVFIRAWEKIPSFQFRSAFGTWLHRLGVNVVLGDIRSDKRLQERVTPTDAIEDFQAEVQEAMPETKVDLERAIALLPPGAKEVLVLHDIEGYRYREIAEITGTAEGTVKSQLNRARRLVREALLK